MRVIFLMSFVLLLSLGCGKSNTCEVVSFRCSGGFYGQKVPPKGGMLSYEKWVPQLELIENVEEVSKRIYKDFLTQKELGNFTILSMAWHANTYIPNFVHSLEYYQFLSLYSLSISRGVVDYLNIGEETDWEVRPTMRDLRERFPMQKLGSWPGRPVDFVEESDFYIFDDYHSNYVEAFDFLFQSGKSVILVINATPISDRIQLSTSYFQAEMAREYNWPILFFAVDERNGTDGYYMEGETKSQFLPYYQMIDEVMSTQLKFR